MEKFRVEELPEIDQRHIKRGICPWCMSLLYDGTLTGEGAGDICPGCGDEFVSALTIKD